MITIAKLQMIVGDKNESIVNIEQPGCLRRAAGRQAACWYNEDSVCDLRGYSKLATSVMC